MKRSKIISNSRTAQNNEFYTIYPDIDSEVSHYISQLKGKRILCPCEYDSEFDLFFCYDNENEVVGNMLWGERRFMKRIDVFKTRKKWETDGRGDSLRCQFVYWFIDNYENIGYESLSVSGYDPVSNDGIRFEEINYSKYDVIVTNPPFSLLRKFIKILFENDKKFLIIGPQNAIGNYDMADYIGQGKIQLGYNYHLTGFRQEDGTLLPKENGTYRSCCWYTNMEVNVPDRKVIMTKSYKEHPEMYPKYINYNAIDVQSTSDIPYDYDGEMGVPLTFIQQYNPKQFEILGESCKFAKKITINGIPEIKFAKLLIRKRNDS